jgi:hypothetical protein
MAAISAAASKLPRQVKRLVNKLTWTSETPATLCAAFAHARCMPAGHAFDLKLPDGLIVLHKRPPIGNHSPSLSYITYRSFGQMSRISPDKVCPDCGCLMRAIMVKYRYKSVCRGKAVRRRKSAFCAAQMRRMRFTLKSGAVWADVPCANLIKRSYPMHAIEKIMAKAAGVASVRTGEIVNVKVDFAEINDLYLQTVYSFYEMGGQKVWDKDRAAFVFDHYAPAPTIQSAKNHGEMREFARKNELTYHFDVDAGVCHQVMPEAGLIYPGMIVVATDSHTTTHGAFGAFGTGVGATDMACILMTGELWMRVPQVVQVRIDGQPGAGVYPKDVILHVLGKIKADGAVYKAIDFTGSYVENLDVSGRMVLCNMAVEMGAKTAYMQPNTGGAGLCDAAGGASL